MTLADVVAMDLGPVVALRWAVPLHINYLKDKLADSYIRLESSTSYQERELWRSQIHHLEYEIEDREQRPAYYRRCLEEYDEEKAIYAKEIARIRRGRRMDGAFVLH